MCWSLFSSKRFRTEPSLWQPPVAGSDPGSDVMGRCETGSSWDGDLMGALFVWVVMQVA